jgi:WD40 repeat protein
MTSSHADWRALRVLAGRDEVAAGNAHGVVAIWNYETGDLRRVIAPEGEAYSILELAFSSSGARLAVSASDLGEVRIYDPASGELVRRVPSINHTAIALSPDGRKLAVDSLDNVAIFDIDRGQLRHLLKGHSATITSLQFSSDGKLLASGSVDRTVRLWSSDGEHLVTLTGHLADVAKVAFTLDGRTLVSLDQRGVAAMAHVATRQTLFELPPPAERLRGLALAPDSRRLAVIRTLRNRNEVVILGTEPQP